MPMFGYLNLSDPAKIADNESQIALNCTFDRGYLEYKQWGLVNDDTNFRNIIHPASGDLIYIDRNIPLGGSGNLYRDRPAFGIYGDPFGCPSVSEISGIPVFSTASATYNPYPPGIYQYIITLFDERFIEESYDGGSIFSVSIGINQITKITFPNLTGQFPTKLLKWRVYRRPIGASEFLFVAELAGNTTVFYDYIPTDQLGRAYSTQKNVRNIFPHNLLFLYQYMLFAGAAFSEKGIYWAFPLMNNWGFIPCSVAASEESLFLFRDYGKYKIVYGNSADDFVVKDSDIDCPTMPFSSANNAGMIYLLNKGYAIVRIGLIDASIPYISGVSQIDRHVPIDISGKIKNKFPLLPYISLPSVSNEISDRYFVAPHKILENRFIVWKHAPKLQSSYPGIDQLFYSAKTPQYLVYDSYGKGFLEGDSSSFFVYRTKEFGNPDKIQQVRRVFVEYEGAINFTFWGDNGSWYSNYILPQVSKRASAILPIKPHPHHYHSFEFRSLSETSKVYSYGVVE